MIPRYKGDYKIPSYNFSFFDTKQKKYVTKKTQSHSINVLKSNNDENNTTSFSQQKVESVNNDINYIKNSTIFSEKNNQTINLNYYIYTIFSSNYFDDSFKHYFIF